MQTIKVTNIAELRLRVGSVGTSAELLGYYTPGDGGGGLFYWDSSSTVADNNGTVFAVSGVTTGRWLRLISNIINIKEFGAKGDGTTDDTLAIQKALDYAEPLHAKVIVPIGEYKTETIYVPSSVSFKGTNNNLTSAGFGSVLLQNSSNDVVRFKATLSGSARRWYGRISNLTICGKSGEITGNGINFLNSTGDVIVLQDSSILEKLVVRNMPEHGIWLRGAFPATLRDIVVLFNNLNGINLTRTFQYHALDLTNISADGNQYAIDINGLAENDNINIYNLKSEHRVNTVFGNAELQFNAIRFINCNKPTVNINGANHISSVPDGVTYKKPGALIKITTSISDPIISFTGVNIENPASYTGTDPNIIEGAGFNEDELTYKVKNGFFNSVIGFLKSVILPIRASYANNAVTIDASKNNIIYLAYTTSVVVTDMLTAGDGQEVALFFENGNVSISNNANFTLMSPFISRTSSSITFVRISAKWVEKSRSINISEKTISDVTSGYIIFGTGTLNLGYTSSLFWDNINKRLGIGTNVPSTDVHYKSDAPVVTVESTGLTSGLRTNIIGQSGGILHRFQKGGTTIHQIDFNGNNTIQGNLILGTAGNKIQIATGTNASVGFATLIAGTVTVATTAVTSSSIIFVSYNTPSGTLGFLSAPAASIVNGVSFVINSYTSASVVNTADTSTVKWWFVN